MSVSVCLSVCLFVCLSVCVLHLPGHHSQELREVNGAVAVGVHLIDHILEFGLSRVLSERSHDSSQPLCGDGAISVLVEQGKGFLELSDLLLCQLIGHVCSSLTGCWLYHSITRAAAPTELPPCTLR